MNHTAPEQRIAATQDVLASARTAGAIGLRATLALQLVTTALRLCFAAALAFTAGSMIEAGSANALSVGIAVAALLLSAAASLFAERRTAAAEADVAEAVRAGARQRLAALSAREVRALPAGALIAGLQRHPESVAALVIGHRAAALMLGMGPALVALAIVLVSWQAALALLLATPVMIMFFIVVGGTIHASVDRQEKAFGRLAAQFEDRIRTLPTILASHGLRHERDKLTARTGAYAASTMRVLRVAFLNAGIIDFFASLSIAVLAVLLGLGHLKLIGIPGFSDVALWQSLFILMLAPEFFLPFRRYAEQYHAKAEGQAAAASLDALLQGDDETVVIAAPAPDRLGPDIRLPAKGLVALVGESGAGKSTLLRRLAGIEATEPGGIDVPADILQRGVDWISTDIPVPAGTLTGALTWNRPTPCPTKLLLAASRVGLLDDLQMPAEKTSRAGNVCG